MSEEELKRLESSAAIGGLTASAATRVLEELRRERALIERLGEELNGGGAEGAVLTRKVRPFQAVQLHFMHRGDRHGGPTLPGGVRTDAGGRGDCRPRTALATRLRYE